MKSRLKISFLICCSFNVLLIYACPTHLFGRGHQISDTQPGSSGYDRYRKRGFGNYSGYFGLGKMSTDAGPINGIYGLWIISKRIWKTRICYLWRIWQWFL